MLNAMRAEDLSFSFIIPVFNRPDEIKELLESFTQLEGGYNYEIVIVEDGSEHDSRSIVNEYSDRLSLTYLYKENSGPGSSRNYGMCRAAGNYFIILDSDILLPTDYLLNVYSFLESKYVDCFGGPDSAHESFTSLQKAINFVLTSPLTTGGIRGGENYASKFQPRSFNMGISKRAFQATEGFGNIHPGEDPDLALRLRKMGYETSLISEADVHHKRRTSWRKFYKQVNKFGTVRNILNVWHPESKSLIYWLPSFFVLGFFMAVILAVIGYYLPILIYGIYMLLIFLAAFFSTKSISVAIQALIGVLVQFFGYGLGYLKGFVKIKIAGKQDPKETFSSYFFKE